MTFKHALAPAGLARMSHVSTSGADLDRTRRFYEDVFRFQTVIDRTLQGHEFEKITGVSGARSLCTSESER
jgi:catechol 2,3-dioxygenase-like lactoylglutathione lyase family enzyme